MNLQRNLRCLTPKLVRYGSGTASPPKVLTRHYDEITIPVPWGHLSGKWYGPKHVRPIVGMHGWQDNAGTFDTLAPLLPSHLSFLSLDAPGHGLSSWLPAGITYHSIDYVLLILRLMQEFKWDKISILSHSMGSFNGFVFNGLFPDKMDMFIGLDILSPPIRNARSIVDILTDNLGDALKVEQRMHQGKEPPAYEWDQLVGRLYETAHKTITPEGCKILLQRNCKPSSKDSQKYYFSRDSRLKNAIFYSLAIEVTLELAQRIKCPHLFIKALKAPYFERKEYYDATLAVLKKNPLFEYQEVDGTHHVHLNEPEKVAPLINSFINKLRPE